jgi:hypothetical protein
MPCLLDQVFEFGHWIAMIRGGTGRTAAIAASRFRAQRTTFMLARARVLTAGIRIPDEPPVTIAIATGWSSLFLLVVMCDANLFDLLSFSRTSYAVHFLLRVENDNACAHRVMMVRGRRSLVNSFIAVLWI